MTGWKPRRMACRPLAGPVIICNTGGGNVGRAVYRIVSFAHVHDDIGKFKKTLLHAEDQQER